MNGLQASSAVVAALLALLLLMGGFPATSALVQGGKGYDGTTRRTFSRREGCFGTGCHQSVDLFHSKGSQMLGLRLRSLQPPPPPTRSQGHIFFVPPAPPPAQ